MSLTIKRIIVVALVLGGLGAGVAWRLGWLDSGDSETSSGSARGAKSVRVAVYELAPRCLEERLALVGTLRADESVQLRAEVAGRIESIQFEEGDTVEEGALLVELDDDDLRARREVLREQLELAREYAGRRQQLADEGAVTERAADETRTEAAVLEARIERLDVQIERHRLRAPFRGTVGLREVSIGAYIQPDAPIATLRRLDPIELDLRVPQRYIGRIEPGSIVRFRVPGVGETRRAHVVAREPSLGEDGAGQLVRARTGNSDGALVPGAFARARVVLDRTPQSLLLPASALVRDRGGPHVFVIEEGAASRRSVEVGRRTPDRVEITDGLEAGARVAVTGLTRLEDGTAVEVVEGEDVFDPLDVEPDWSDEGETRRRLSVHPSRGDGGLCDVEGGEAGEMVEDGAAHESHDGGQSDQGERSGADGGQPG